METLICRFLGLPIKYALIKQAFHVRGFFLLSLFVGDFLIPLFMFILGLTEEVEGSVEGKYNGEWLLD